MTLLHKAASGGYDDIVDILLSRGADPNSSDINGATALHYAAKHGHCSVGLFLLTCGADINAQKVDGFTPLHQGFMTGAPPNAPHPSVSPAICGVLWYWG